ncbi:MAG: hypothetical protein IKG18_03050 [Atopobiaceae bacterium]|nr:hypothetical protein [Atopobiaceae bacterium]
MAKNLSELKVPDGVDVGKANLIIKWLIDVEEENNRTGRDSDTTMVQRIGKRIWDDVRCL